MNTTDPNLKERDGVFALFKGASGTGKTVGALSYPGVYMADFDKKMPAIALKHFRGKAIEYDQFDDIFQYTDKMAKFLGVCPYETILNDSITSMVSLILKTVGAAKGEGMERMLQNMKNSMGKFKQELLSIDYYNAETRIVEHILDIGKTLYQQPGNPKNVLYTAHILQVDSAPDLKTKVVTTTRSIVTAGRKVAAYIPTQFDEVYLFGTSEVGGLDGGPTTIQRMVITEQYGQDDAKTAINISRYTDFTNKNLYDLFKSQIAGKEMFL